MGARTGRWTAGPEFPPPGGSSGLRLRSGETEPSVWALFPAAAGDSGLEKLRSDRTRAEP